MPESLRPFPGWPEPEAATVIRATYRRLLETWIAADRNFEDWRKQNPDLNFWLLKALSERISSLQPGPDGRACVRWLRPPVDEPGLLDAPTWVACEHFIALVTSQYDKAVYKCDRCGNYYLSTSRRRRKRYCSRRCGSIATATESMSRRRLLDRQAKLERVARALGKLESVQPSPTSDWKTWVSDNAGVTRKFLTRAVNKGDVQAPPEKRRGRTSANL